jgi:2'-5' RNA ligase
MTTDKMPFIVNTTSEKLTARVFFALWPDEAERGAFAAWQLPCGGRVMRRETLHATLVFMGEVAMERLEALKLAAEEVSAERFELVFDRAGYWGHNHILYATAGSVAPGLLHLVRELERNLSIHHFEFDPREYKLHVTLRRNAHWRDDPLPEMPPVHWRVKEFVLLQSEPQDGDASYRVLARFPLTEPGSFDSM